MPEKEKINKADIEANHKLLLKTFEEIEVVLSKNIDIIHKTLDKPIADKVSFMLKEISQINHYLRNKHLDDRVMLNIKSLWKQYGGILRMILKQFL